LCKNLSLGTEENDLGSKRFPTLDAKNEKSTEERIEAVARGDKSL